MKKRDFLVCCARGTRRWNGRCAFTLVELLVSSVLTVVVAAVVYTVFFNGVAIWQRATGTTELFEWRLLTDRLELDLRNAIEYSGIDWQGTTTRVQFPMVYHQAGGSPGATVARMEYVFTPADGMLSRRVCLIGNGEETGNPALGSTVTRNLTDVSLTYGFFSPPQNVLVWSGVWPPENSGGKMPGIPRAIRLTVYKQINNRTATWERTVLIPLGKKW